jgi:glutathione S-transferase
MTLRLYDYAASCNCYKARLLLAHLGIPYERRTMDVIDRSDRPEVLGGLNPALRVPTLVLDDGRAIGESNAILWYLAEGTAWIPDDRFDRAKVLQWQFFEQYEHEPTIAVARFMLMVSGEPERYAAELPVKQAGGYRALDAMERHLDNRAYLVGDSPTLADISLYGYTHVADEAGLDMSSYPAIGAWLDKIAALPGHVAITA